MSRALEGLKFFKNKFPNSTYDDVWSIIGLFSAVNLVSGAFSSAYKGDKPFDHLEQMFGPQEANSYALLQFFGINTRDEHFDPKELSDTLNWDKEAKGIW